MLFVFRDLVVGGEETEVRLLAKTLDPTRYRVEVVACVRTPGMPEPTHRQLEEIGARAILELLEALSGGKPVVTVCWEKLADPSEWCHRRMLADYLRA